ncbi:MAG: META domain-containing protein [Anaerolineae bacterium]|jgi:heat shock protein HslJ
MTRRRRTIPILGVLVVMSLISACQGGTGGERGAPEMLVGTEWTLVSLHSSNLIEDTEIPLYFTDRYLGGRMTCNHYGGGPDSGAYTATDDGRFMIDEVAVTVRLCLEPEGVMEQEAAYIEALLDAAAYQIINDRLEIAAANGEIVLAFEAK